MSCCVEYMFVICPWTISALTMGEREIKHFPGTFSFVAEFFNSELFDSMRHTFQQVGCLFQKFCIILNGQYCFRIHLARNSNLRNHQSLCIGAVRIVALWSILSNGPVSSENLAANDDCRQCFDYQR